MTAPSPYAGQRIALLTQHGKEQVIAPVLEPALNCTIQRIEGFDTDTLGTFTRDIPRTGSQLDAARRKARIGMELSGLRIGLGSEGAFGLDPMTGLFPWNVECLVLLDDILGIEVVGLAQGATAAGHQTAADWSAAEAFAGKVGFPAQQLVVRPDHDAHPLLRKGLSDWSALRDAFDWAWGQSTQGQVFIETDLRAHGNPARMQMIEKAAQDLLQRLQSLCPACGAPGFSPIERIPGLPCRVCHTPTQEYQAEVWSCVRCHHRQTEPRATPRYADPGRCPSCNP